MIITKCRHCQAHPGECVCGNVICPDCQYIINHYKDGRMMADDKIGCKCYEYTIDPHNRYKTIKLLLNETIGRGFIACASKDKPCQECIRLGWIEYSEGSK